jgi:GT2 family glycosyltransferase
VAVIVASEPGPWFEEVLACFGSQDYPNLSVLVVDGCRTGDSTHRVASVLPEAYVRRVDGGGTFASLANDALETVQGAAFLAFCHDDVAPDPDAVRRMVEEAFRSNAAVVAPKLVEWDRPERLLDVGLVMDKTGTTAPVADRGELDQEQHDAVRDVFAVTNTFMLVRSDLFAALGGFDTTMGDRGVDVPGPGTAWGARKGSLRTPSTSTSTAVTTCGRCSRTTPSSTSSGSSPKLRWSPSSRW